MLMACLKGFFSIYMFELCPKLSRRHTMRGVPLEKAADSEQTQRHSLVIVSYLPAVPVELLAFRAVSGMFYGLSVDTYVGALCFQGLRQRVSY